MGKSDDSLGRTMLFFMEPIAELELFSWGAATTDFSPLGSLTNCECLLAAFFWSRCMEFLLRQAESLAAEEWPARESLSFFLESRFWVPMV